MLDSFVAVFMSVGLALIVIRHPIVQRITPIVFYGTIAAFIFFFFFAFLTRDFRPNTDTMTFAELQDLPGYIQSFHVFKKSVLELVAVMRDPYLYFQVLGTDVHSFYRKIFLICADLNCPVLAQPLMYSIGMALLEATNNPKITLLFIQLTVISLSISASLSFFSEVTTASQTDKILDNRFKYGATLLFLSSGLIFWSLGSWLRWGFAIVLALHLLVAIKREQHFLIMFASIGAILTHTGSVFLLPVIFCLSSNKLLRVFGVLTGICLAALTFSITDGPYWQMSSIPMLNLFVKVSAFSVGELSGLLWGMLALSIALVIKPIDKYLQISPLPNLTISIVLLGFLILLLDLRFGSGPAERLALGYVIIFSLFVLHKFIQTQRSELFKTRILGIMGIVLYLGSVNLYFPSTSWL